VVAHHLCGIAKSSKEVKSGNLPEDCVVKCSLDMPKDIMILRLDREGADKATSDINHTISGMDQISEADYSKEFKDILQLISRLTVSIK
jgi:hypothetical protein